VTKSATDAEGGGPRRPLTTSSQLEVLLLRMTTPTPLGTGCLAPASRSLCLEGL